jgi:hypothetical protein
VWVGEFGCEAVIPDNGQERWVAECIGLFEQAQFEWTYWNFRETTGPGNMALQREQSDGSDLPVNEPLLDTLRQGWSLNGSANTASAGD